MLSVIPYPIVNGYEPSYSSVEIKIGGVGVALGLPGVKSISYKEGLTSSKVYANSPFAQGRTRGQLAGSGSIELYRRMWDQAVIVLSGNGLYGFSERSYTVNVSYSETGYGTISDVLTGVRVHSPDLTNSEGTDALTVKCELDILNPILWNGMAGALTRAPLYTIGS